MRAAAAAQSGLRSSSAVAVGPVEEHVGTVVPDGAPDLDHEVGPGRIVGVGAEPGRLGHRGAGQGQVALRGRRHRPQVVAPGAVWCRGVAPLGQRRLEVARAEVPGAQRQQPARRTRRRRNRPARPPRWRAVCGQCPAVAPRCPMSSGPSGHSSPAPGRACDEAAGQRQHDRGREAVLGQLNGRGQHVGQRQPPVALVQGEPAVDGARHLHAADVAP